MNRYAWSLVAAVLAAGLSAAGCNRTHVLSAQAEDTYARLASAGCPADPAMNSAAPVGRESPTLYFAPRDETAAPAAATPEPFPAMALAPAMVETPAGGPAAAAKPGEAEKQGPVFESIDGKSFGEILKSDARGTPARWWKQTKYTYTKPENLAILGVAFGVDRIVRNNWDDDVRRRLTNHDTSLEETGDFGGFIGNPLVHFGIAGAWYTVGTAQQDAKHHAFGRTMLDALALNGMATMALKGVADDRGPNGEWGGWPSGHMSSSVTFASVIHEYYGWKAALPLYALAGYAGASRLEDREHDLSDLVFGAALGWVIGHSTVTGELPQIAGFTVLPYGGNGTGGVMFLKQW